ncbi:MAG TPA: DUF4340 domain-containing protein [Polyangia bacterium]|jgi:hypothetical protein|nr:DUF4340 domain-containing protein [Polyangia bacterium]
MNRKTLTAVVAFAILGIIAVVALRQPEKGEGSGEKARPLAKIDPAALDTLVVTRNGHSTTITKDGGKYAVTAPGNFAADETAAKSAFEAVGKLELGDLVSENKAKQAEFDIDDAKGIHVVAEGAKGTKVLADVIVGKTTGTGTMVRLAGKDQIWQADAGLRAAVDRDAGDWRDKSITTFAADDAQMLTVKTKDGGVAIAKRGSGKVGADDKWDLVTSVPKIDNVDNSVPAGIVTTLATWKTNGFSEAKPAETGLDAPRTTITVALKGGKNVTVLLGNKKSEDEIFVKTADAPQVYLVKKFNAERVDKRPLDFKDRTLSDVSEADLNEVAVSHGADSYTLVHEGTAWKATKPAKLPLDPGKTPSIGGAFKAWKAAAYAEDTAPAVTGLAKPQATITIKAKGQTTTFKVGNETKDKQNVYLATSKSSDVYLVPKWSTDRLLLKIDDLKKK